jgi:hypothetical protein
LPGFKGCPLVPSLQGGWVGMKRHYEWMSDQNLDKVLTLLYNFIEVKYLFAMIKIKIPSGENP